MALHIHGAAFEGEGGALEARGSRHLGAARLGARSGTGHPLPPSGPPLRVTNPERFAAFLREAEAHSERLRQAEDEAERARAHATGQRYRTRPERAAAALQEELARARDQEHARRQQERARADGDADGGAHLRRFDASVDHYAALGCAPAASRKELRRAYRAAALRWHPDKQPPDADASQREAAATAFKAAADAAEVLLDGASRRSYDEARARVGSRGRSAAAAGGAAPSRAPHSPSQQHQKRAAPAQPRAPLPDALRVELALPLSAYILGGCFHVSVPENAQAAAADAPAPPVRVRVQPGARAGDQVCCERGCGEAPVLVTLLDAPDPVFARSGAKDVRTRCASPPLVGDTHWAGQVPVPAVARGRSGVFAHAWLLPSLLSAGADAQALTLRLPGLGLPDQHAPCFDPPGVLLVDLPLPPRGCAPPAEIPTLLRVPRLHPRYQARGRLLLTGSAADPLALAAAVVALPPPRAPRPPSCVCLLLGGGGGSAAAGDAQRGGGLLDAARRAALAWGGCAADWTLVAAPLCGRAALQLLEEDWQALQSASLLVLCVASALGRFASDTSPAPVAPPPPPPTRHASAPTSAALFTVVYQSAVAVRLQPSLEGEIVSVERPGASVLADGRWGAWVRLARRTPEAWMLREHGRLGTLLVAQDGRAAASLPRVAPCGGPTRSLRVAFSPAVAVRTAPSADARVIASRRCGERVEALAVVSGWARVACAGVRERFGWIMVTHPQLGALLAEESHSVALQEDSDDSDSDQPEAAPTPFAALSVEDTANAFAAAGLQAAVRCLWLQGTHMVALGGDALALCGIISGGGVVEGLLPYILRESDANDGEWSTLHDATMQWPLLAAGRGVPRAGVTHVDADHLEGGWHASCERDALRRVACERAASVRDGARRAATLQKLRAARAAQELEEAVWAIASELPLGKPAEHVDAFGQARGACRAAGCLGYARPALRGGPNAALLLCCAACGEGATQHVAL